MSSTPHSAPAARAATALDRLADQYVEDSVRRDPFLATSLGVPGHDHEVTDYSPAAVAAQTDAAREMLTAIAEVPDEDAADAVTRAALTERLGLEIERAEQHLDIAQVNNLACVIQSRDVLDQMPTDTTEDWEVIAARMSALPRSLSSWVESLHEAAKHGVIAAQRQLRLGAEHCRSYAAPGGFFERFATEAKGSDAQKQHVTTAAQTAAQGYRELADALEGLIDKAPEPDAIGRDAYPLHSRTFLGTEIDIEETYAWGIEELRRVVAEQEEVASRINAAAGNDGGTSVAAAKQALDADPARILHGTDALQAWMQDLSDRAIAELAGTHFDIPEPLTHLECMIARTGSGGIYYTGPSEDLTRPGRMWWDVPEGTTEFRTWLETTTVYHEGVPGHHLQVGTQTLQAANLNRWRALMCWISGHGEGWGLYAERLMDQLGYLADDGDRLGMLDAQRLRAGRVVLDIGLHCQLPMPEHLAGSEAGEAWTYERAWEFMSAHWGVTEAEQRFELHRYLGWPGQAPSYKIGQRMWEQLRAASAERGEDAKDFHRRALELGSLPLDVLQEALK